jgi:archaellum component FlaC
MEEDDSSTGLSLSSLSIVGFEDIIERLQQVEKRLGSLEALQKQDADESVGMLGTLNETVEELEDTVEKLEGQVEHHTHLLHRYRVADLFGK